MEGFNIFYKNKGLVTMGWNICEEIMRKRDLKLSRMELEK